MYIDNVMILFDCLILLANHTPLSFESIIRSADKYVSTYFNARHSILIYVLGPASLKY